MMERWTASFLLAAKVGLLKPTLEILLESGNLLSAFVGLMKSLMDLRLEVASSNGKEAGSKEVRGRRKSQEWISIRKKDQSKGKGKDVQAFDRKDGNLSSAWLDFPWQGKVFKKESLSRLEIKGKVPTF